MLYAFIRTTVDLDDILFRKAKARAAMEGISLQQLLERVLRTALDFPVKSRTRDLRIPILKAKTAKKTYFPPDVVNRMDEFEDRERHEAALRSNIRRASKADLSTTSRSQIRSKKIR